MKTNARAYCITLTLLLFSLISIAQELKVRAQLDSGKIRIGEQAHIELIATLENASANTTITWPALNDTIIKGIDIIERSKIDTIAGTALTQKQTIAITSFDSGYYAIPPFTFYLNGDTSKPYFTEAMLLEVHTIAVDTTIAIRDIKAIMDEPFDWHELIPYAVWTGIFLAVLAGIIALIYFLTRKKPKPVIVKPVEPPHVIALRELDNIKSKNLWQEGKSKEYYTAITDVLRLYIEQRYRIQALELTSEEILLNLRSVVIDNESKNKLKQILKLSDLVKFAKEQPIGIENEMSWQNAVDFVKGTLREEETPQQTTTTGTQPITPTNEQPTTNNQQP